MTPSLPSAWRLGLSGAALAALAQPPADLWMLAWVALVPWLMLAQLGSSDAEGRLPALWGPLWACGFLHWLAVLHWLRLPHPATAIGWVFLSAFLGLFVPAFVLATRLLVRRWGVPLCLAAPLAWIGLEQARGTLFGGFTMASIAHTQWRWTRLIQTADILGDVGVGGLIVLVAAGIVEMLPFAGRSPRWRPALIAAAMVLSALGYGTWRLSELPKPQGSPLEILLVQGSIDTELKQDPGAATDVASHYDRLTVEGLGAESPDGTRLRPPDLVAWPETMWRWGLLEIDPAEVIPTEAVDGVLGQPVPSEATSDRQARGRRALEQQRLDAVAAFARRYGTQWLVGLDRQVISPRAPSGVRNYNSALFLDASGRPLGRYDKMHPVLFGERMPFGERFPWLYRLTPLPAGLTAGERAVAVEIAGHRVAANICYETTLPAAVRSLVLDLAAAGMRPDCIVNLTNDGWFWGSSELDMHLACGIFRAVEVRTPIAIAANTGLSASIDGSGRLLERGPRRATAVLRARVERDGRTSPFLVWGAAPAAGCLAMVLFVFGEEWLSRRRSGRVGH